MQVFEIIVGLLLWGGLLVLVSMGAVRLVRGPKSRSAVAPPPRPPSTSPDPSRAAQPPPPTAPMARLVFGETEREAGALVDGLIIGHHLTRTHYKDRLEDQAETIDALRTEAAAAWYPGDDADTDDGAEDDDHDSFDDHEGFEFDGSGSGGGFGLGAQDSDFDPELDDFDAAGDPWEDDIFGFEEDDED